jgi:hypothetical protein
MDGDKFSSQSIVEIPVSKVLPGMMLLWPNNNEYNPKSVWMQLIAKSHGKGDKFFFSATSLGDGSAFGAAEQVTFACDSESSFFVLEKCTTPQLEEMRKDFVIDAPHSVVLPSKSKVWVRENEQNEHRA